MQYWILYRADGAVIPYTGSPRPGEGDRVVRVEADDAGEAIELAEAILARDATGKPR